MNQALSSALERLYRRRRHGIKPGLGVPRAFMEALGHPEAAFGVVHVAGTNGKGSVCAIIESILRAAGLRTGLYTSPHLVAFNERFRVNGTAVGHAALEDLVNRIETLADPIAAAEGKPPTFFECSTAIAFEHFRREHVQVAVVETGMGGRLDATNVVIPLLSVITRIALDHTDYLGTTVAQIAFEKAGIIKPGRPVVCGAMPDEAREVIREAARTVAADFVDVTTTADIRSLSQDLDGQKIDLSTTEASYGTLRLPLLGTCQLENLAAAVVAVEVLTRIAGCEAGIDIVKQGAAAVDWPARCQVLCREPLLLLDSAHNESGALALADALRIVGTGRPVGLVCGMCADKDVSAFVRGMAPHVKQFWAVPVPNERSMAAEDLAAVAAAAGLRASALPLTDAVCSAAGWVRDTGGVTAIAGSLFLAGEVLASREPLLRLWSGKGT